MTFTKLFASITESTIWCEDDQTRIVWITMLAMANKNGFVFASIPGLAKRANVPIEPTRIAIAKFQEPDPDSRSREHEGRRIEEVDGGWRLLTYMKHRAIRDEEDRREYLKHYMRDYRKQKSLTNVNKVNHGKPQLTQAEAEAEAEAEKNKVKNTVHFVHPSLEEITLYCQERKNKVDPQTWWDHYTSNGWKVGRNSMKNWKAAIRTWEKSEYSTGGKDVKETFGQIATGNTRRAAEAFLARRGVSATTSPAIDVQPGTDRGRLRTMAKTPWLLPPEGD